MVAPQSQERPAGRNGNGVVFGVCVLLVVAVGLVFGQTLWHEFVDYDDDAYVYANPQVVQGLTPAGLVWAFTYSEIGHWHPLTWLSHMLDCQLWGLNAGGHHLTNVVLHAANAVLLFLVLRRMMGLRSNKSIGATTPQVGLRPNKSVGASSVPAVPAGALWPSAFVAAVFAIHPLRVESVAWVAERKDVLSGLFFMLTLWAYTRYAQKKSGVGVAVSAFDSRPWTFDYCLVLLFFVLGLLSKNMLVTLPFVLLLLDYWPLNRFELSTIWPLLREKLPLFVLAATSCAATGLVSEKVLLADRLPFSFRIENAPVSYAVYLWQMVWPVGLAIPYPNPVNGLPLGKVAAAVFLLIVVSLGAFVSRRKHPYFVIGWLWYCGMLVPVSGLVQISYYAHADRYTYLPQIGLYIIIAWAAKDLTVSWRYRRQVLWGAALGVIAALMICAWKQTSYWRNSESLWTHTLVCMPDNTIARVDLDVIQGNMLAAQNQFSEAVQYYQRALELAPDYAYAHCKLGTVLILQNRFDEAIEHLRRAIEITPAYAEAHCKLGYALGKQGRLDEAIEHYRKAIELKPGYTDARNNLANALVARDRLNETIK